MGGNFIFRITPLKLFPWLEYNQLGCLFLVRWVLFIILFIVDKVCIILVKSLNCEWKSSFWVFLHLVVFAAIQVGDVEDKDYASESHSNIVLKDFLLTVSEFWLGFRFRSGGVWVHLPVLSCLQIYIAYYYFNLTYSMYWWPVLVHYGMRLS